MNIYNKLSKNVFLPLSDFVTGWDVHKSFDFLMNSQYWTKEELYYHKLNELKKIVKHAYVNLEYYRNKFNEYDVKPEDIKEISDIKKLPILTKDDIIENFDNGKIIAKKSNKNSFIFSQSSGSIGKRTRYFISKNAYGFNIAANLRGWSWMGYNLGDRFIKISQNKRNNYIKIFQDKIDRTYLFTLKYNENNCAEFLSTLYKFKPKYLRSYPDPLMFIASYLSKKKIKVDFIESINTTGNILFPEVRSLVEEIFNCKIFDSYSCEGSPNVFECPTHNCYHISEEYGILELLNNEGSEVTSGKLGRVVVTDFYNYAMPILRYESMDLAEKGIKCSCGRQHKTIKKIIGRDNDILVTPSGQFLIGQTFTTFFKMIPEIEHFQVIQPSVDSLQFKICVNKDLTKNQIEDLIRYWQNYTNNEMKISIEFCDEIPLLFSGKRKFLIRDKSIEINL